MAINPEETLDLGAESNYGSGYGGSVYGSGYGSPVTAGLSSRHGYGAYRPAGGGGESFRVPKVSLDTPILDAYEDADYTVGELGKRVTAANATSKHWKDRHDDYTTQVLQPYHDEVLSDFGEEYTKSDPERGTKMIAALEEELSLIHI